MTVETSPPLFRRSRRRRVIWAAHRALRHKMTWIIGVPQLSVVVLATGGFAYLQYMSSNAPPPLSFADVPLAAPAAGSTDEAVSTSSSLVEAAQTDAPAVGGPGAVVAEPGGRAGTTPPASASRSELDGVWTVGSGSVAGYRIGYTAVGVHGTRVGRGTAVTGEFHLAGTSVQSGQFSVDFRSVKCDGGDQCDQHVREIMDTENYPFETFALTHPIELRSIPADGKQVVATAKGQLTLRGVTRSVEFPVSARRNAGRIEVLGSIPVNRDDYKIPDANEPGFSIDRDGLVEFLLLFDDRG